MSETERLLAVRAALVQTTNTVGWQYVKQMAANIVTQSTQAALDEEDRELGESKRLKAKAMQSGFRDFFNLIETGKTLGTDAEPDWFSELNKYEEMAHGGSAGT